MTEPLRQVEIQLGHMCNNRCVFCVSGQRTARGQAGAADLDPVITSIRAARAAGHEKITLLGGEPTLQPIFLDVLRECAALGFQEVVVFTNGAKTAREGMIDDVLETGAPVSWRISIQGATEASHERTTKKDGSFGRIVRTLEHLHRKGQRISINMCVVASNYEEVDHFASLVTPYGVHQLHLDLMRPLDAGDRTDAELEETLVPLDRIGAPLRRMVAAFPESFDVNVGNLPFCLAPEIAERIHHDGQPTETIAIDGDDKPSRPFDKYLVKARDKVKPPSCARCVFDPWCTGVYDHYLRFQGTGAIAPVDRDALPRIDPSGRWLALRLGPLATALRHVVTEALGPTEVRTSSLRTIEVRLETARGPLALSLVAPGTASAIARYDGFDITLSATPTDAALAGRVLGAIALELGRHARPIVPLGDDAVTPVARPIAEALRRIGRAAPFGGLTWDRTTVQSDGQRVELGLVDPRGARAAFFVAMDAGRPRTGYRVEGAATDALATGLRAVVASLRTEPAGKSATR